MAYYTVEKDINIVFLNNLDQIRSHLCCNRRLDRSGWARLAKFPPGDTAIPDLLARFAALPIAFAPLFGHRSWLQARLLRTSATRALGDVISGANSEAGAAWHRPPGRAVRFRETRGSRRPAPRMLRAQMLQMTWRWLVWQPGSALARWYHQRTAGASGRMRRVTKARILAAVREVRGEVAAERIASSHKPEMAEAAERLLAGTGWLPTPLRTPGLTSAGIKADGDVSDGAAAGPDADAVRGIVGDPGDVNVFDGAPMAVEVREAMLVAAE